jgi:hypothetical protein
MHLVIVPMSPAIAAMYPVIAPMSPAIATMYPVIAAMSPAIAAIHPVFAASDPVIPGAHSRPLLARSIARMKSGALGHLFPDSIRATWLR